MLNNMSVQKYFNEFDFMFICETHSLKETKFHLPGYSAIHNPCKKSKHCNEPRGGCVMFIRKDLMKFVSNSDISFNDAIILNLSNGYKILGIYIPPSTSEYYYDHMDFLETFCNCANEENSPMVVCGDLNSRIGDLSNLNEYLYSQNPDTVINPHGRQLINIVKVGAVIPLNHLNSNGIQFEGGFTFKQKEAKSQNDWILCNKTCLPSIKMMRLHTDYNIISDHIPVSVQFQALLDSSLLVHMKNSITDILDEPNNHSKNLKISCKQIDKRTFQNLVYNQMGSFDHDDNDIEKSLHCLRSVCYIAAKGSKSKASMPRQQHDHQDTYVTVSLSNRIEHNSWRNIILTKDPKLLWQKVDWSGKMKIETIEAENNINDFADFIEQRCSLPAEHSYFGDLKTDKVDPALDAALTSDEIIEAAKRMKTTSKSKCGIPLPLLMTVIHVMINVMTNIFNKVFLTSYPRCWSAVIKCLPKKGQLNIPNLRGIGLKNLFAKIYDAVLKRRLERWLDVPNQQTAYQKGKGCHLHVFYVRCLIAICHKLKQKVFIGITDFEAAFDLISRRNLFKKLIELGISVVMLNALVEMYRVNISYVEINNEYSRTFSMTSGVLQGSATSTILFMAYTADLVQLFNNNFPIEELVHIYHILLHADDCLILSRCRKLFEEKFRCLERYCVENSIRLQPKKCSFIAINTSECENIVLNMES